MSVFASRLGRYASMAAIVVAGSLISNYYEPVHAAPLSSLTCTPPSGDPEIAALARSLRYDLSLIYEYVYYNVDSSPSWGSKKGALGTYLDQRGNNIDQNVLFVELLRQSCISANYRSGAVAIPTAALANLLGVQNDVQTVSTVLGRGGFSGNITATTSTVNWVWTEATVNNAKYELDPSFKSYASTTPIDLPAAMGYNKTTLLNALGTTTAPGVPSGVNSVGGLSTSSLTTTLNQYATNLANYIKANRPSSSTAQVYGGRSITNDNYGSTFPAAGTLYSALPASLETVFTVSVSNNADGSSPFISSTLYASQLAGKRLTLIYNAGKPQLMLDGIVLSTGAVTSAPVQTIKMAVAHPYPAGADYSTYSGLSQVKNGGVYAIMLSAGEWGRDRLTRHQRALAKYGQSGQIGAMPNGEPGTGEGLAAIGTAYLTQSDRATAFYGNYMGFVGIRHASMGVAGLNTGAYVDFPAQTASISPTKNGQDINQLFGVATGINVINSTLESTAVNQLQANPAVSTVRMMDYANRDASGIVEATAANWSTVKPLLKNWSTTDLDQMGAFLLANSTNGQIIVPLNGARVVGTWKGSGYYRLARASQNLDMGYLISGGYNGGYQAGGTYNYLSSASYSFAATAQRSLPSPASVDPIDLQSGNFTYEHKDIDVGSAAFPFGLALTRFYNSGDSTTTTELGNGWRHNFMLSAMIDSDSYEAYGDHNALAAVPLAVTAFVVKDLSTDTRPVLKNIVASSMAASWMMDQFVNNAVTVKLDQGTKKFMRLPDGTYIAPPGDASTLQVNGDKSITLTDKSKVVYSFDTDGKIKQWKDPSDNTASFTYTGTGTSKQLQSVSNGMGRTLTFAYTNGRLTSVNNGSSTISYTYGGTNNTALLTFVDRKNASTRFAYEPSGRLQSGYYPSFPNTPAFTNTYDVLGRVKTQSDALGNLWTYLFANGRRSEEIDPTGANRSLYFDGNGNHIEDIDQLGYHTVYIYDGVGRRVQTTYPGGDAEVLAYDARSNVLSKTTYPLPGAIDIITGRAPSPLVKSWTYDSVYNKPLTEKNPRGYTTTYGYDSVGRLVTQTQPSVAKPGATAATPITRYLYNSRGQVTQVTDPEGRVTVNTYDTANGNLSSTVADSGRLNLSTTNVYDAVGNLTKVTDPSGAYVTTTYDVARRRTLETPSVTGVGRTQYSYDLDDRVTSVQRETGIVATPWSATSTTYNVNDKVINVAGPDGVSKTTTYDSVSRVLTETMSSGRSVVYAYDAASRVIKITDQVAGSLDASITRNLGSVVREQRTYYNTGGLATLTDAKGNVLKHYYDGFKRLSNLTYADGSTELHGLDVNGNEQVTQNRSGQLIWYSYDPLDRMESKAPDGQPKLTYGYDYSGRRLTANDGTTNLSFSYDTAGRAISEQRSDIGIMSWTVDANGRRKTTTWPGSYSTTAAYDGAGRLTDIYEGATMGGTRLAHYTYDLLSERTAINYGPGSTLRTSVDWTTGGQVAQQVHTWSGGSLGLSYTYNLDHQRKAMGATDASFLPTGTTVIQSYSTNVLNQYLTAGGQTLRYDTRGNVIGDGTWTYSYDVENHLVGASKTGTTATYAYDPLGRRASKTINGVTTYYLSLGDQEVAEYNGSKQVVVRYVYGVNLDEAVAMVLTSGVRYYHLADALGSTIALVNDSGSLTEKYAYSAYGMGATSSTTPYRYAGRRLDPETGLYHNRARAYSPMLGRFLQADPIGVSGGINLYVYTHNDPLNKSDPMGTDDTACVINPSLCNWSHPQKPDYYEINVAVPSVFAFSTSVNTGNGNIWAGGGFSAGKLKDIANGKNWGIQVVAGRILVDPRIKTPEFVDSFISEGSWATGYYDIIGAGLVHNSSGTALEVGFGIGGGGASYNNNGLKPVGNTSFLSGVPQSGKSALCPR